jgi:glycosyltransferase involved in cell wall biosynthesis
LKAGLVIYGSLDTITGGYLYDRKFVEGMRSKGHSIEVFSQTWRSYPARLLDNFSAKMPRAIEDARLDLLLEDELNHPSLFHMNRRLRKRMSVPVVSVVHHLRCSEMRIEWQNSLYRYVEQDYLSTVDGFVFNSLTTKASVESLIGTDKPCVVAYPGKDNVQPEITPEMVAARALEPGPLRILFVGSLIPRKELHTLLAALSRLPKESWRLDVVGSSEHDIAYAQKIFNLIADLRLQDNVTLFGSLTSAELAGRYGANQVLAVPSSYEGFGIVYLEGMGFGLPALASRTGAAGEIVTQGRDGFLVNPGDAGAIAAHLEELFRTRDKLAKMSLAALDRYAAHPTWSESAASITKFFEEVIRGGPF